ncbi:hypothetical protein [Streptomyces profundus]|uniref:hypothetical protein n=1 Tax=Streptomyces profundus TaxID=2867410 RepID=UPI001D15E49D|nr:hypothetical protein [Streptomyces sp. MA3_2.13]UED84865.1 hypothetical protein K4G22_12150 [Streptomyces sp. MA3_2.13]
MTAPRAYVLAYLKDQAILPLRTEHSTSMVALVEGLPDGHRATGPRTRPLEQAVRRR